MASPTGIVSLSEFSLSYPNIASYVEPWLTTHVTNTITNPSSGYYPYAFGTTDYSTLTEWPGGRVVGIHGPYYDARAFPGTSHTAASAYT